MKRRCACGTFLSRYNTGEQCWSCWERARLEQIESPEPPKPTSTGNPSGLCKCGCGQKTPIAKRNRHVENILAGVPVHYMPGHALINVDGTNSNAKLTAEKVVRMRREYAAGGINYREIARKYGCRKQTAIDAIRGVTWAHVLDEAA